MEGNVHNMNESTHIDKPSKAGDIDSEPFSESLNNVKNNDYTFDKLKEHMDKNLGEVLDEIRSFLNVQKSKKELGFT